MTKGNNEAVFVTGLRRGYIRVADRVESDFIAIPSTLKGMRGNIRWALEKFSALDCTHYTVQNYQSDSVQYCFTVYRGYKEAGK